MLELLTILADGEIHSGAEIGEKLGITRAGVWKRIQKLPGYCGCGIESISGQGYRLKSRLELLDEHELRSLVAPGLKLLVLQEVDSTNEHAKRLLKQGAKLDIVVAEMQTRGKGRRGREWCSPYGSNLYLSYIWPVTDGMRQLEGLSLAVGLAVFRALEELGVSRLGLKWPNDVLVGNKKIAGVLLELVGDLSDQSHVVIGIGINVNMQESSSRIGQPWTSLGETLGGFVSRHKLLARLLHHLGEILQLLKTSGFMCLREEWQRRHLWQGEMVTLSSATCSIAGRVAGINERGELGLETNEGLSYFAAGEMSLRMGSDS